METLETLEATKTRSQATQLDRASIALFGYGVWTVRSAVVLGVSENPVNVEAL